MTRTPTVSRTPAAARARRGVAAALAAAAAFAAALPGTAAARTDVGVSIDINQPGVYGRIDIGRYPQPQLIVPQPVIVQPAPVYAPRPRAVAPDPAYLWVPPGHRRHWSKHCHRYDACGVPVYFVRDDWYRRHVMPTAPARYVHTPPPPRYAVAPPPPPRYVVAPPAVVVQPAPVFVDRRERDHHWRGGDVRERGWHGGDGRGWHGGDGRGWDRDDRPGRGHGHGHGHGRGHGHGHDRGD